MPANLSNGETLDAFAFWARRVGMHDLQAEVFSLDSPRHLPLLLPIHLVPAALDGATYAFPLLLLPGLHGILAAFNSTWLGPGGETVRNLSIGVRPFPFSRFRPPPSSQSPRPESCFVVGQKRSKVLAARSASRNIGIFPRKRRRAISASRSGSVSPSANARRIAGPDTPKISVTN